MTENFKYKIINNKEYIFDIVRKKYVLLTKEEWVRQQILHYFITQLNYPLSLISVEKQITIGQLKKRYDIVVYKNDTPWLIVECKQEEVPIDKHTVQQVMAYTSVLKLEYLSITNGRNTLCYQLQTNTWSQQFPHY